MHSKKLLQLQREESILLSLKKLDYLTTTQLMVLHNLKSERNARRVLHQMSDKLSYRKDGHNIYFLNSKGREIVGCEKIRKGTGNIEHFIMRNSVFIEYGMPGTWRNEIKISNGSSKKDTVTNIADALFQRNNVYHIVEVDNRQNMPKNRKKIANYRTLVEREAFGEKKPVFVWVTHSESRRIKLKELHKGLNVIVHLYSEII